MITIEEKLRAILKSTGWRQQHIAEKLNVTQATVSRWFSGSEPEGHRRDAINQMYDDLVNHEVRHLPEGTSVPLMGYLGAGAEVEPEYEQVPHEGLEQIEIPFHLPDDMIAFKVRGDSMLPVFKHDSVIVVYRDQKKPLEAFYGEEAAVRTQDGRRFIKTIMRGQLGVNLLSWNAAPIEDVVLDWVGEIFAVLPPSSIRKMSRHGIQGQLRFRG
ncbi:helix-turn-helix domain-containing protein [Phyllobacterium sp. BT25]|uniref:Helix-turn-helix domain-containing protein n=1 Tax=Phyllobacterium pellucidum TaxID=2740464 RepID=A0A849VPL9_9HYPH|nr:XRE family transcriptional regulator [Phyllobacterium pellucidum]NTS30699.1 helix-turn-helix domain-containing protein [Phyllobacterium pellucidum]